jgi:hypothetical protein
LTISGFKIVKRRELGGGEGGEGDGAEIENALSVLQREAGLTEGTVERGCDDGGGELVSIEVEGGSAIGEEGGRKESKQKRKGDCEGDSQDGRGQEVGLVDAGLAEALQTLLLLASSAPAPASSSVRAREGFVAEEEGGGVGIRPWEEEGGDRCGSRVAGGRGERSDKTRGSGGELFGQYESRHIENGGIGGERLVEMEEEEEDAYQHQFGISEGEPTKSRKQRALGYLCEQFLKCYAAGTEAYVDDIAKKLSVERRRIYDIMNALEAVEIVSKGRSKKHYECHGSTRLHRTLEQMYLQGPLNKTDLYERDGGRGEGAGDESAFPMETHASMSRETPRGGGGGGGGGGSGATPDLADKHGMTALALAGCHHETADGLAVGRWVRATMRFTLQNKFRAREVPTGSLGKVAEISEKGNVLIAFEGLDGKCSKHWLFSLPLKNLMQAVDMGNFALLSQQDVLKELAQREEVMAMLGGGEGENGEGCSPTLEGGDSGDEETSLCSQVAAAEMGRAAEGPQRREPGGSHEWQQGDERGLANLLGGAGEEDRTKRSKETSLDLRGLVKKAIRVFLHMPRGTRLSLDGLSTGVRAHLESSEAEFQHENTRRRLYDVVNILCCLNLVEKCSKDNSSSKFSRPLYRWRYPEISIKPTVLQPSGVKPARTQAVIPSTSRCGQPSRQIPERAPPTRHAQTPDETQVRHTTPGTKLVLVGRGGGGGGGGGGGSNFAELIQANSKAHRQAHGALEVLGKMSSSTATKKMPSPTKKTSSSTTMRATSWEPGRKDAWRLRRSLSLACSLSLSLYRSRSRFLSPPHAPFSLSLTWTHTRTERAREKVGGGGGGEREVFLTSIK